MMKTGIELISQERQEQIEKHGFDVKRDSDYSKNELVKAAMFCVNPELFEWPYYWHSSFRDKILAKTRKERLVIAGALIAAELDRMNAKD